ELRAAALNDTSQFVLQYQPIIDMQTSAVVAVEALVRWQHPRLGLVFPASFLDLAEETGAILPIGEHVLDQACEQAMVWRRTAPDLRIAVNLSARQLQE